MPHDSKSFNHRMTKALKVVRGKRNLSCCCFLLQGIVVARKNFGVTICSALKVHRNAMAGHTVLTDRTRATADV